MDPSTPTAQDVQNQAATQPVNRAQPPQASLAQDQQQVTSTQSTQQTPIAPNSAVPKAQISIGNVEAGGASSMIQEAPDADVDEDDEDELKVAPQETKTRAVGPGGMADLQEEVVEMQPAVPEVPSGSVEVEKFVEKSPDLEKPDLPKAVSDAGVTHSGPGVIAVQQNNFGVKQMPATYQQAAVQVKKTKLHDSQHWLMATIMYIWRKLNPQAATIDAVKETSTQNATTNVLPAIIQDSADEEKQIEL